MIRNSLKAQIVMILVAGMLAAGSSVSPAEDMAGVFFGTPVSKENYMFLLRVVMSYQSPWGGIPRDREQAQKRVWDELLLSYEAYQRGVDVDRKDVEEKITETLKGEGVAFNWKEEPQAYAQWVRTTLNESVELFENQMQHLAQVKKLYQQVMDGIDKKITDEEITREFLNENNSLSVELAEFDTMEEAEAFYNLVKNDLSEWDKARERDVQLIPEDRRFHKPGFVALEFLMDMWKFPQKAVYDMIEMKKDDIYPPQPVYKGYGVFRILDVRRADPAVFEQRKERIINQLKTRAKYDGFKEWLEQLRKRADVQIYMELPQGLFP